MVIIAASLVAYAINTDGFRRHKADLNDGGVWVTNGSIGAVGRENVPISQLDAFAYDDKADATVEGLDVLQDQAAVLSYDVTGNSLVPVDVARGAVIPDQRVSIGGTASMGGGVVSVVDEAKGGLWATAIDTTTGQTSLATLSSDTKPLVKSVGPDAKATVGPDGSVVAASAETGKTTTLPAVPGGVGKPTRGELDTLPEDGIKEIAAVGGQAVVLDNAGHLITPETTVDVGTGTRLQQSGPADDEVLVATDGELIAFSLSGNREVVAKAPATGDPGRPVELNNCAWAVWAAGGEAHVVSACGDAEPTQAVVPKVLAGAQLTFRVNRNQIVLNDAANGDVWRIDGSTVQKIDDWDSFRQTKTNDPQDPNPQENSKETPPRANDDELGVRTGRTTVLHVLDNDEASKEVILAVVKVDTRSLPNGISVQIAPDRQSLLADVSASAPPGDYSFNYTIDDGSRSAKATDDGKVKFTVHAPADATSGVPKLREHFEPVTYFATTGGTVEVPVTQDWRDDDYGDPIAISKAKADAGRVGVTSQGLLKFVAPDTDVLRTVKLSFDASTGGQSVPGNVQVRVLPSGRNSEPAQALADAAAGQVGGVVTIRPLENDIPGADPNSPDARMELAGSVAPVQGQPVDTDRETGVVSVRPTRAGSFVFTYSVAFGNAKRATGQIRVQVSPRTDDSANPVAAPDSATLRGLSPVTVDVLANDFDPKGGLLAVTSANPTGVDSKLEVAIIDGRWLRVNATEQDMQPRTQAIQYTISNGSGRASGSLTITQEDPLDAQDNQPVTEVDKVTVRAGTSVAVPVLDNDSTPSGDPVALVPADSKVGPVGTYEVLGSVAEGGDRGTAYLAGRQVRYIAPASVEGPLELQIQYIVENTGDPLADRAFGTVKVHITPADDPNDVPTPRAIEGRIVQGDLTTLRLAPAGLDPDGDPVSIVAVGDSENGAPHLGRIVGFTGSTIDYQAFPGVKGTDAFSYVIDDGRGGRATGSIRVAVVEPGPPQPPVAIDDLVTADANRSVLVDVLGNDLRTPGTELTLEELPADSPGARDEDGSGLVKVKSKGGKNNVVEVPYRATNGIDTSPATLRVRTLPGYNNPPVAEDVIGQPEPGAESVTVPLSEHIYDIDGGSRPLKVAPIEGASMMDGNRVRIMVTAQPQTLPYVITDSDGAVASAVILVPAKPKDFPYLKTADPIKIDPGKTVSKALSQLVGDPENDTVYFTTLKAAALFGAPQGALSSVTGKGSDLVITAGDKPGPATVTFTVSDRPKLGDKEAHVATLTVPVQIGDDKPVITCPDEPLTLAEGGSDLRIDIASVCHVWTSDPSAADSLTFEGQWKAQPEGIDLVNEGRRIVLRTGSDARRGDRGSIAVAVDGQPATATLNVLVTELPPPTLGTINIDGHAGKPVTVDVAERLRTKVSADALDVNVISVTPVGNSASAEKSGSRVKITPKPDTDGLMRFRVVVSDLGPNPGNRPTAVGEIRVAVAARADKPTNLVAGKDMLSNTVVLSWTRPEANGARITNYKMSYSSSKKSGSYPCAGTPCRVTGLPNGVLYTFSVTAINAEGESDPSNTDTAQPDAITGPVLGLTVVSQDDHKVKLRWSAPGACDCSAAKKYRVSWADGGNAEVTGTEVVAGVTNNGTEEYTFTVIPINDKGDGERNEVTGMGAGKPEAPTKPEFVLSNRSDGRKAVTASWGAVAPNGPNPVEYQVTRTGGGEAAKTSTWQTATSWDDDLAKNGETFSYQVIARNGEETSDRESSNRGAHVSAQSPTGTVESASTPDPVNVGTYVATGSDGQVRVTFTTGKSNGKDRRVECRVSGGSACGSPWTYTSDNVTDTKTFASGIGNGGSASIEIRLCNGSQVASQSGAECSTWSPAKQTTPYGAIGTPHVGASPSGDSINVTSSWDANGKNVNVVITRNGTNIWSASNVGSGSHNFPDGIGYNQTGNYQITVSDTGLAPGQTTARASRQDSASATTSSPPATVSVRRGGACHTTACTGAVQACANTCYFVLTTGYNFPTTTTCHLEYGDGSPDSAFTWLQGNTETNSAGNWVGPGIPIRSACNNGATSPWVTF